MAIINWWRSIKVFFLVKNKNKNGEERRDRCPMNGHWPKTTRDICTHHIRGPSLHLIWILFFSLPPTWISPLVTISKFLLPTGHSWVFWFRQVRVRSCRISSLTRNKQTVHTPTPKHLGIAGQTGLPPPTLQPSSSSNFLDAQIWMYTRIIPSVWLVSQ